MNMFFWFWLGFLILWGVIFFRFHKKINQPFGLIFFGVGLIFYRLGNWGYQQATRPRAISLPKIEKPQVKQISDLISAYQLGPTEVILGMDKNRPVRVDLLDEKHTLLGGSTGGAKTYLIHAMLIQLFGKNSQFTDAVDVYVVDFKGLEKDNYVKWLPLLAGYAKKEHGKYDKCFDLLKYIKSQLEVNRDKKILLIIEEAVVLTAHKEGDDLFSEIVSQLRMNGSLVVTIQHPQYKKMQTFIKNNIERRICGLVVNRDQAGLILEVRPKESELPLKQGQYIIKEPGRRTLTCFEAMKPNLPEEIETIVMHGIETMAQADERLRIFFEVAVNKKKGASIVGAQTLAKDFTWLNNAQFNLMVAYRNFAQAGVFLPPEKQGSRNKLAVDFEEGFAIVKKFIEDGKWRKEAEKVI